MRRIRMSGRAPKTLQSPRVYGTLWKILLVFVFFALSLLPSNASAASITVSPTTVVSGNNVIISGSGFPANTPIIFWLDTNGNGQLDLDEPAFHVPVTTDSPGPIPPGPLSPIH